MDTCGSLKKNNQLEKISLANPPIPSARSRCSISWRRLTAPVLVADVLSEELTELQEVIRGHQAHLSHLVPGLEPLWVRGWSVQDLKAVSFREAELCVSLGLERVECHHHIQDILCYAVGVRVVNLLLGVVRGEPPDLERLRVLGIVKRVATDLVPVLPPPPAISRLLQYHHPGPLD